MTSPDHLALFSLAGKTAVVTGGSRGIGFMIAKGLLDAGARVVISSRKEHELLPARDELSKFGEALVACGDHYGRGWHSTCTIERGKPSTIAPLSNSGASSLRKRISLTTCGLALPPVSFITWPMKKPSRPSLPER